MNKIVIIIIGLLIYSCHIPQSSNTRGGRMLNKVEREVFRVFEEKEIELEHVDSQFPNLQIFKINYENGDPMGFAVLTLAQGCMVNGCIVERDKLNGEFEEFTFLTIYNLSGVIEHIRILDYNSEYGYEIASVAWLRQFFHKPGVKFTLGDNIDAISGATVTVKSLISTVNTQQIILDSLVGEQ